MIYTPDIDPTDVNEDADIDRVLDAMEAQIEALGERALELSRDHRQRSELVRRKHTLMEAHERLRVHAKGWA